MSKTTRYQIQGRLLRRADGAIVRDEVRLSTSDSHDDAARTARGFVADGFTTWIFLVEASTGPTPLYRLLDTLHPTAPKSSRQQSSSGRSRAHHARVGSVA